MKILRRVIPLLLAAGCAHLAPEPAGLVEGKVVFDRERVAGALVTAVTNPGVRGEERRYEARSGEDGSFLLRVPPGSYYLSFRRPPDLAGYFGGNPVNVQAGIPSQVVVRGVRWPRDTVYRTDGETRIEGLARLGDAPIAGAVVQVFLDASNHFRGPGYAQASSDAEGRFFLPLPPGRYYVLARQRRGGERMGPLKMGDQYAAYPGNPVFLREGQAAVVDLPFLAVEKEPGAVLAKASGGIVVRGTVRTPAGTPVAGVRACLYRTPDPLGMPDTVAEPSAADGSFFLRVTGSGTYYLVARRTIGRPLEKQEYLAFYRGPDGHRLTVDEKSKLDGLIITWEGD